MIEPMQLSTSFRPSSSSVDPGDTVVYIVYYYRRPSSDTCTSTPAFNVHAVNILKSQPGDPLPEPILTLPHGKFPSTMGVGCLGSSIYFIRGEKPGPPHNEGSLEVFILDTDRLNSTTRPIEDPRSFLRKGPRLNGHKSMPFVVTVGRKLYVISHSLHPSKEFTYPKPRVEVLDRDLDSWIALPEPELAPPSDEDGDDSYMIAGYDVLGSRIVIWMGSGVTYELDTDHLDWGWIKIVRDNLFERARTMIGPHTRPGSAVVDSILFPYFTFPDDELPKSAGYLISLDTSLKNHTEDDDISSIDIYESDIYEIRL